MNNRFCLQLFFAGFMIFSWHIEAMEIGDNKISEDHHVKTVHRRRRDDLNNKIEKSSFYGLETNELMNNVCGVIGNVAVFGVILGLHYYSTGYTEF